jgi:hypothetical protein
MGYIYQALVQGKSVFDVGHEKVFSVYTGGWLLMLG